MLGDTWPVALYLDIGWKNPQNFVFFSIKIEADSAFVRLPCTYIFFVLATHSLLFY